MLSETTAAESPTERQSRLRAELLEREVREKRSALAAEMRGYLDAEAAARSHRCVLDILSAVIKSALPELVTVARQEASERDAAVAARAWWRSFRQRQADRFQAEAEMLPEFVPYRGEKAGAAK